MKKMCYTSINLHNKAFRGRLKFPRKIIKASISEEGATIASEDHGIKSRENLIAPFTSAATKSTGVASKLRELNSLATKENLIAPVTSAESKSTNVAPIIYTESKSSNHLLTNQFMRKIDPSTYNLIMKIYAL